MKITRVLVHVAGPQWIGVPGELWGYKAVHKQYGRLPWAKLFQPTIRLARGGLPVSPYLGRLLQLPLVKHRVETSSLWYNLAQITHLISSYIFPITTTRRDESTVK